jgi:hypothetical protein
MQHFGIVSNSTHIVVVYIRSIKVISENCSIIYIKTR